MMCSCSYPVFQLIGEREVKGVVKLRFKDMAGNVTVCHRMLQSIQKVAKRTPPVLHLRVL